MVAGGGQQAGEGGVEGESWGSRFGNRADGDVTLWEGFTGEHLASLGEMVSSILGMRE